MPGWAHDWSGRAMSGPRQTEHPAVSVIVPVYNDGAGVDQLLAALAGQTLRLPYEVIVIDDASSDLTLERVGSPPNVRYLRLEQRSGSYAARNAGLETASAPILAFTDADCMPASSWLERGLAAFAPTIDMAAGPRRSSRRVLRPQLWSMRFDSWTNSHTPGPGTARRRICS